MDNVLWALAGSLITAAVAVITIKLQLSASSNERMEAIFESLLHDLMTIVQEMREWNGKPDSLEVERKRLLSRMIHMHLDSLVEAVAVEGRCGFFKRFLYMKLKLNKSCYRVLANNWLLTTNRFNRFEHWYSDTLILYQGLIHQDTDSNQPTYIREVFHPTIEDPHEKIKIPNSSELGINEHEPKKSCLYQYFNKRQQLIG